MLAIDIDLRSDTVTRPSDEMRHVMAQAPVGDAVYGDDPSVIALEEQIASLLGFEAALFVPSGTQANLCSLMVHCQRGDEYLVGQQAHAYRFEGGGAAVLGSIQPQPLPYGDNGSLPLDLIRAAVKPNDDHFARTRLLTLENTFGGQVLDPLYIKEATQLARELDLTTHLDGARLFNAAIEGAQRTQTDPWDEARRIAQHFDSVSVCFSKGLGAPVGSAICSSRDFITQARRIRKLLGGSMRQAGILASAASYALDHHFHDLHRDHVLAHELAQGLRKIPGIGAVRQATNMVFARLEPHEPDTKESIQTRFIEHMNAHNILVNNTYELRFVTHRDVNAQDIERTLAVIQDFFA